LSVEADSSPEYLAGLMQLFNAANLIAPETLKEEGPLLRITPDGAVSSPGNGRLSAPDRELAEAARRLFSLYRSLGGQTGARPLLFQRTKSGLFAAREGLTGTLSTTLGGAMGGALQSLARADASLPASAASWIPQFATALENPGTRPPAYPVARIARNQRTMITLSGPEIARAGADAILAGPPGSTINILKTEAGRLLASTVFSDAIPDGFAKLYLYRAGDALTPVASFDVSVGAGRTGAAVTEPDDHGATPRTATALLPAGASSAKGFGQIGTGNDVDMFALRITEPGLLALRSHGSSDVIARLTDSRGNPVASNDDGGDGYNFGIHTMVNPGNYLLSVQHCCGGNGKYQIDTTLTPR
ncbi:MAG: hypothetical protein ABL951_15880, partial [Alphaproteobacteria bacterium]